MPETVTAIATILKPLVAWFQGLSFWQQALIRLGASLLLSAAAQALTPRPSQRRQLNLPNSRPPKRFVYGHFRTYGTPVWRVKGRVLYGCIILNSRPSAGTNLRVFMDKRECLSTDATALTSDVFDFSGGGALLDDIEDFRGSGSRQDNPRVWIGLGDQTGPPVQIASEVPEYFETTDAWKELTVMWVRLNFGRSRNADKRWRAVPPEFEVQMDWSKVWDLRDESQDPDDPDTWTFNNNQALCLLDGLRQNPIRRYPLRQVHLPSFIEAADVADENVPLYHDSVAAGVWPANPLTEPRYTANGILIWAANEIEDQLAPIAQAGAGDIVRIGGRVGYASGEYRPPLLTVTDIVASGGIEYQVLKPGRDLPRFVKGGYVAPERDWQEAEIEYIPVEGSTGGVGDDAVLEALMLFVTSPTQCMRVSQIIARQLSRQKTLAVTLWPEAVELAAGATIATALPSPFARINGEWTVVGANPGVWVSDAGEDSAEIAVRVPVVLRENDAVVWEWVPEQDEQGVDNTTFTPVRPGLAAPTNLVVTTGDGVSTQTQARLRVDFDPVEAADDYVIELRQGDGPYVVAAETEASSGILLDVEVFQLYSVRVRSRRTLLIVQTSDPVEVENVFAIFGIPAAPGFRGMVIGGGPIGRRP